MKRLGRWSATNWFLVAAPLLLVAATLIARATPWAAGGGGMEAVLLFDMCVTLPLLYALCYGRKLKLWQLAVRMVGIACLGIYLLSYVVPVEAQVLLPSFGWARTVGVAVLILVELRLLVAGIRIVFRGNATAEQISATTGAPPVIAKLMLLEARFWKAVWRFFRRNED
jgi:hypothetical protein